MAEWLGRGLQNLLQRFESASDLRLNLLKLKAMGVTRLKRKDRKNKTTSRLEVQFLKLGRNIEIGSRSQESKTSQIAKNNEVLAQIEGKK
ncbi:MAG: spore protein [Sphingobacteriaceae bacterium]|nr:spore protein [Sphingobacteriaceae bacterium]